MYSDDEDEPKVKSKRKTQKKSKKNIIPFRNITTDDLINRVNEMEGVECDVMFNSVFDRVDPITKKVTRLRKKFKPEQDVPGLHSIYMDEALNNELNVAAARDKLDEADYRRKVYNEDVASLKLHVSLNGIADLDQDIIFGLIELLARETNSEDNDIQFKFKVIDPIALNDKRMVNNDQFTIYFDKYSSTADVLRLARKIDKYLKKHIPENAEDKKRGPKDSFSLNSFVSARFDNNKLLGEYGVYPFFDLEIEKFINAHETDELEDLPLCAFEAVFNTLIASKMIKIPKAYAQNPGLNDEDSIKVQAEFEKILKKPKKYMLNAQENDLLKAQASSQDSIKTLARSNRATAITDALIAENIKNSMETSVKEVKSKFFVSGYKEKSSKMSDFMTLYSNMLNNHKIDVGPVSDDLYDLLVQYALTASTPRGGALNFHKAEFGETRSAKAFYKSLESKGISDAIIQQLKIDCKPDSEYLKAKEAAQSKNIGSGGKTS